MSRMLDMSISAGCDMFLPVKWASLESHTDQTFTELTDVYVARVQPNQLLILQLVIRRTPVGSMVTWFGAVRRCCR